MRFRYKYTPVVVAAADDGEPLEMYRPELKVIVSGPAGDTAVKVLVDTGADYTMFPSRIAAKFGIPTQPALGPQFVGIGGKMTDSDFADVELEIGDARRSVRWASRVFFNDSETLDEVAVIGHFGFLEFFIATFDSGRKLLILEPNEYLPRLD